MVYMSYKESNCVVVNG